MSSSSCVRTEPVAPINETVTKFKECDELLKCDTKGVPLKVIANWHRSKLIVLKKRKGQMFN